MNKITYNTLVIFLMIQATCTQYAAPGDLDTTFGDNGIVTTSMGRMDFIMSATVQPDDKIVISGFSEVLKRELVTARFNTDGTFDPTFNSTGIQGLLIGSSTSGNAVTLQADDKIVVCGYASEDQTNFAVARYNADGSLDTTFNGSGFVTTSFGTGCSAESVKMQADGKIVVGGRAVNGSPQFALVRYNADGSIDNGFGSSGIVTTQIGLNAALNQIAIQADGKILAVGYVSTGATIEFAVARYNSDGSLDTGFGLSGVVTTLIGSSAEAKSIAIQADGGILVAGSAIESDIDKFVIVRYNADGSLDTSFNTTGIVTAGVQYASQANAIAIQSDDNILVGGFSFGNQATQFALARLTPSGDLDLSFGTNGIVVTTLGASGSSANINALAIQSDGKIVAQGSLDASFALARYLA